MPGSHAPRFKEQATPGHKSVLSIKALMSTFAEPVDISRETCGPLCGQNVWLSCIAQVANTRGNGCTVHHPIHHTPCATTRNVLAILRFSPIAEIVKIHHVRNRPLGVAQRFGLTGTNECIHYRSAIDFRRVSGTKQVKLPGNNFRLERPGRLIDLTARDQKRNDL